MKKSYLWGLVLGLFIPILAISTPSPKVKLTNLLIFPQQGKVLTKSTLIKAIRRSKKYIYLASPLLNDPDIISALEQQVSKGTTIQIIVGKHKSNAPLLRTKAPRISVRQRGSEFSDGFSDMNACYLLIDDNLLLFSGIPFSKEKLTPNPQGTFPQGCRGFGYIIHDKAVIGEVLRIFKMDWASKRVIPKGGPVIWGPDNVRSQWSFKLKQAQSSVMIMTPHLTDDGFVATLAQLSKENVKIKILTMAFKPQRKKTSHEKNCALLRKNGVDLHYFPINQKNAHFVEGTYILIDESQLLLNSAHINPNAMDQYRQFGIVTMNNLSVQEFLKAFNHDWQQALRRI